MARPSSSDGSQRVVKLCDFGFAVRCGADEKLKAGCGTPLYMAPELVKSVPHRGFPLDVWAFGCVAYEMLHARPAFCGDTLAMLQGRIRRASHAPIRRDGARALSPRARWIVSSTLVVDASARPTAAALVEHLQGE